jgi:DNA-binding Xre family transcriptional regulator
MEVKRMRFSYNKLWKLLIDRGINKKTLREMSGISATSVAKLGKGGNVNTDVLLRICDALNCDVGNIMEFVREDKFDEQERKDALTNG